MKVTPYINMKMDCEQVLFNDVVGILTIKTFDQSKKENIGNAPPPPQLTIIYQPMHLTYTWFIVTKSRPYSRS